MFISCKNDSLQVYDTFTLSDQAVIKVKNSGKSFDELEESIQNIAKKLIKPVRKAPMPAVELNKEGDEIEVSFILSAAKEKTINMDPTFFAHMMIMILAATAECIDKLGTKSSSARARAAARAEHREREEKKVIKIIRFL